MAFSPDKLKRMANAARSHAMRAIAHGQSGHVGIALGAADIMTAVYANHLRFNPDFPNWADRDRFVLSPGHGSALLYSVLKLAGYDIPDLSGFRSFGSPLAGHPEYDTSRGIECSTGPLGQGVGVAVGMALAAKMRAARGLGDEFKVYCLCSDGDLMEGVSHESIGFAGRYNLDNLIILWDDNEISIDGAAQTEINIPERMAAAGFHIIECDGNDAKSVNVAIGRAKKSKHPAFVQCKTIIGLGSSVAGTNDAHGLALDAGELNELADKFADDTGEKLWQSMHYPDIVFDDIFGETLDTKTKWLYEYDAKTDDNIATRNASGMVLAELSQNNLNTFIGGSADLAHSTNTKTKFHRDITPDDFSGNFINYGVREHAMAAIMNGLCACGFRPYGGTFLVFSDYMRASIRLSALMNLPVIYVFSHDSIAVGEDGPTHQPIEQLASLRLMPDLNVYRPADITEVAACWDMALRDNKFPSCMILSRQKLPKIAGTSADGASYGGYIVSKPSARARTKITLIATGSEVSLALAVQRELADNKIGAQVVSMPSVEKFREQSVGYKKEILNGLVIAIEAGATYSWYEFADAVAGVDNFGMSGPGADVYRYFGFNQKAITADILKKIKGSLADKK